MDATLSTKGMNAESDDNLILIIILVIVIIITILGIIIYINMPPKPTSEKYKDYCGKMTEAFDIMGISRGSPMRMRFCPEMDSDGACPLNKIPKSSPDPPCMTGLIPGKNAKGEPCCVHLPKPSAPPKENLMAQLKDFASHHPLISLTAGVYVSFRVNRVLRMLKVVRKGEDILFKPVKYVLQKGEELLKPAGQAIKSAIERSTERTAARAAEKAASKAGAKAAEKGVVKAAEKGVDVVVEKSVAKVLEKIVIEIIDKVIATITETLAAAAALSSTGIGSIMSFLMLAGMLLDFEDPSGYHQFISNRSYLDTRDMLEGIFINSKDDQYNLKPPFHFSLTIFAETYGQYDKEDVKTPEGKILSDIYHSYKDACSHYQSELIDRAFEKIDPKVEEQLTSIIQDSFISGNPPDIPQNITDNFKEAFKDVPKDRDELIYNITLANVKPENSKYFTLDLDISTNYVHGVTLTYPDGYNLWNKFVASERGAILPMAVYSEYYRVIESQRKGENPDPISTDKRHRIRDGVERAVIEDAAGFGGLDLRGQTVYTLRTKKYHKKIMQVSLSKGLLKTYCERGMHLPSIGKLLASMADKKTCEWSGAKYTPGSCDLKEFAVNQLDCLANDGKWTPSTCVGGGGSIGSIVSGAMEKGISAYTGTVQQATACMKNADSEDCKKTMSAPTNRFHAQTADVLEQGDDPPEKYGMRYDDDTGICKHTWFGGEKHPNCTIKPGEPNNKCDWAGRSSWCERQGQGKTLLNQTDDSLTPHLTYTDCDTGLGQDISGGLFGETLTKGYERVVDAIEDESDRILLSIGGSNMVYAFHHPGEKTGSALDKLFGGGHNIENAGKAFDKFTSWIGL